MVLQYLGFFILVQTGFFVVETRPITDEALQREDYPSSDKLIFLQAVWRHGQRSPVLTFEGDLYNKTYWKTGLGKLTDFGKEQHRHMGEWIRRRYIDKLNFLPSEYDPKTFKIRASKIGRTSLSALENFYGLYGQSKGYREPSILVTDIDNLNLPFRTCLPLVKIMEIINDTQEVKEFFEQPIIHKMQAATQFKVKTLLNILHIADPFIAEKGMGLKLPAEYEEVYEDIKKQYVRGLRYLYGYDEIQHRSLNISAGLRKSIGGGLVTEIVNNMKLKRECINGNQENCTELDDLKYSVYSSHDTAMLGILSTLGYQNLDYDIDEDVELASALFFELWSEENGNNYVKIIYRRNPEKIFDLSKTLGCYGNKNGCTLDEFEKLLLPYLHRPNTEQYCDNQISMI